MQRLPLGPLCYEFSRHLPPRLRIASGETIQVEAEDALSGQIASTGDRRDKAAVPYSNPVNGPIFVEGAEPGDSLAVRIESIRPLYGKCCTYTGSPRLMSEWLGADCPQNAHVCPIADGKIQWSEAIAIPYAPMLGCMGVAPDWGVPTTGPAGSHGGNLDLLEVCPGSTIHLPVLVPGGYLYLGDAHAAMGHGELSATGLEMASESTITVTLHKGRPLPGVRIETLEEIAAVATGSPAERSIAEAYARLILWLEADFGWDRWRAYDLLTHVGRLSIGYYGIGTVAAKVARRYASAAS